VPARSQQARNAVVAGNGYWLACASQPLAPEESLRDELGSLRSSVHTMSVIVHRCCAGPYPCFPPLNNGQDKRDVSKGWLADICYSHTRRSL
jgi:hypothetical protein